MGSAFFCHFDPFEYLRVNSGRNLRIRLVAESRFLGWRREMRL
jgi:hypothetical protein